jgi:hypothetical protein
VRPLESGDRHEIAEILDRLADARVKGHHRLPAEDLLRTGNVRLADLRVIRRQRLRIDLSSISKTFAMASANWRMLISCGFPQLTGRL